MPPNISLLLAGFRWVYICGVLREWQAVCLVPIQGTQPLEGRQGCQPAVPTLAESA